MGIKTIIDLRESGGATDFEKREAEKLGMKYMNVPLPPLSRAQQRGGGEGAVADYARKFRPHFCALPPGQRSHRNGYRVLSD